LSEKFTDIFVSKFICCFPKNCENDREISCAGPGHVITMAMIYWLSCRCDNRPTHTNSQNGKQCYRAFANRRVHCVKTLASASRI